MDLHLSGKRVLITGASQGIGFAVASLFAEEGCSLVLVARNEGRLKDAAASISEHFGTVPQIIAADLSAPSAIASVSAEAGVIDILVNNAGAIPPETSSRLRTASGGRHGISRCLDTSISFDSSTRC